jgi:hypothetical protein
MRLSLPRFTLRRMMFGVGVAGVGLWLWACRFAGLDQDETVALVVLRGFFWLMVLAVSTVFILAMNATPSEPLPLNSTNREAPQITIGCLMSILAFATFALLRVR